MQWDHDHIAHIGGETDTPADPASQALTWRKRIEPWLSAVFQSEHLSLLVGNGFATRVIAHELLDSLKSNVTVDWAHREAARARMRVLVKRILRKYGYPPDLQDAAVRTVLQQAEALTERWAA